MLWLFFVIAATGAIFCLIRIISLFFNDKTIDWSLIFVTIGLCLIAWVSIINATLTVVFSGDDAILSWTADAVEVRAEMTVYYQTVPSIDAVILFLSSDRHFVINRIIAPTCEIAVLETISKFTANDCHAQQKKQLAKKISEQANRRLVKNFNNFISRWVYCGFSIKKIEINKLIFSPDFQKLLEQRDETRDKLKQAVRERYQVLDSLNKK